MKTLKIIESLKLFAIQNLRSITAQFDNSQAPTNQQIARNWSTLYGKHEYTNIVRLFCLYSHSDTRLCI